MSSFSFSLEYQPPYFPVTFISADESFSRVLSLSKEHLQNSLFFIVQKEEKTSSSRRKYLGILARENLSKYNQDSEDNDSLKAENLDLLPIVSIKKSELTNLFIVLYKFISSGSDYLAIINDNSDIIGVLAHEDLQKYVDLHTKLNYQEMEKLVSELNITITEDISEKKADNKQEKIFTKNKNQDSQATTKNNSDTIFHLYKIISEHREQERYWHKLIEGAAAISGKDFFYKIAEYISINFDVDYVFITEKKEQYLETLVFLVNGKIQNNFCFPCTNFPCGKAVQEGIFTCQNNLRSLFPNNEFLENLEIEGFAGVQLVNGNKDVIGGLSVGSKSFISKIKLEMIANTLQVFAARITSELEREKAVTKLTNLQQQLKNEIIRKTTQLENNEQKYRTLIENFPGIVYSCLNDNFRTMEFLSSEILNITGYYPEEVTGNKLISYADLIHPDDRNIVNELIQESLQKKEIFTVEYRLQHRDGSIRWVCEKGQGVYDFQGNLIHLCGVIIDVSDRKLIESHINELSKRLQLAVESAQIGIWELDLKTQKLTWDEQMYRLYDVPIGTPCYYKTWTNALHPEDFEDTVNLLEKASLGLAEYDTVFRIVHSDGKIIYIKASGMLEKDGEGKPLKMIGINYDITAQKEAEIVLRESNEKLEKINLELEKTTRMKDEFLASMSHELRTPLNSILGLSEALKEQVFGSLNQKQLNSLNSIHRSGRHLLELINDILDLAKIESGKTKFDFSLVDVVSLSLDSLNFIRYLAEKKNITLTFINEIPSSHKLCQIDERRLRQALINLLDNGIKFTPEGGKIELKINLVTQLGLTSEKPETDKTFIHFSVTDTGIGIAQENISKLFQTFVQIDSRLNRQYAGTGLGLALVKRIVDAHGGFVGVESEINQGSCFSFYIPYSKDEKKECHSAFWHPQNPHRVNLFTKKKIKRNDDYLSESMGLESNSDNSEQKMGVENVNNLILLVDDDEENIYAISDYLQIKGFSLEVAKNGKDALNKLKEINPCIILMDIQMPELDGFETIRLIKKNPRWQNIPIVAVTALAMTGDKEKCLNAGADDYLSKPFPLKDLIEKINQVLS